MPLTAAPYVPMAPANYLILLIRDPPKADIAERYGDQTRVIAARLLRPLQQRANTLFR
jgi:hypothetical protein